MKAQEQRALFGLLYNVARLNPNRSSDVVRLIETFPDAQILTPSLQAEVQRYQTQPPRLEKSLKTLGKGSGALRFRAMLYCLQIFDYLDVKPVEAGESFQRIQNMLRITPQQTEILQGVVRSLAKLKTLDLNDSTAIADLKALREQLQHAKIPLNAIQVALPEAIASRMSYSDNLFWGKLQRLSRQAGRGVVENALVLFHAAHHPNTPKQTKMVIYGALAYFILPTDLIPDFLPILGLSDDLTVLAGAIATIARNITPEIRERAKQQTDQWLQHWL